MTKSISAMTEAVSRKSASFKFDRMTAENCLQAGLVARRHGQLQIVKVNARHLQNGRELFQPERAGGVLVMFGIARPRQPDFQPARLRRRQTIRKPAPGDTASDWESCRA